MICTIENNFFFEFQNKYSLLLIWAQVLLNHCVSPLINRKLWFLKQNRFCQKVDLFEAKRNTSRANLPLLFRSRETSFWIRFWPGMKERSHLKTEERRAMITKMETEAKAVVHIFSFLIKKCKDWISWIFIFSNKDVYLISLKYDIRFQLHLDN